jgi:hypothetical protein
MHDSSGQINWNIGTVFSHRDSVSQQVMRGEELLSLNRGKLSRASPFHADTVSTIYISRTTCMMQPILIQGQKSAKLAQGSKLQAYLRTRSACMILSEIGILNSVWKFGKDDGLIWTSSFCYVPCLCFEMIITPKTKNPTSLEVPRSMHIYITMLLP